MSSQAFPPSLLCTPHPGGSCHVGLPYHPLKSHSPPHLCCLPVFRPVSPHVQPEHISRSPHHTLAPHYPPLHRFIHPSDRERVFTLPHNSSLPYALQRRLKFASSTWRFSPEPRRVAAAAWRHNTPVTSPPLALPPCPSHRASLRHAFCPPARLASLPTSLPPPVVDAPRTFLTVTVQNSCTLAAPPQHADLRA